LLDRCTKRVVVDAVDLLLELRLEIGRRRDLARLAPLGRALHRLEDADAEAERVDGVAALLEAEDELRREHLELRRPHAGRDGDEEHAALEARRLRAIRDAPADRRAPLRDRDRRALLREPILSGAREDVLERLGRVEIAAAFALLHRRRDVTIDGRWTRESRLRPRAIGAWKGR
jgi:hypothetical protein